MTTPPKSPSGNTEQQIDDILSGLEIHEYDAGWGGIKYINHRIRGKKRAKVAIKALIDQTATNRCIEELEGCEESLLDISADHLGYINNRIAELKGKP